MKKGIKILITSLSLAILLLGFIVVALSLNTSTNENTSAAIQLKPAPTVQDLFDATNAERAKVGAPALVIDERLNQSAKKKSDDMLASRKMSHESPRDGRQGYEYIYDATGSDCRWASENIFFSTALTNESVITGWMGSTSHREAILDPEYTSVGFGISGDYVAQHFCKAAK